MPDADDLQGLRRALRAVLAHYLGGRGLKSWELMGELGRIAAPPARGQASSGRSEEHTSELQSLMRISYAVSCLQTKTNCHQHINTAHIKHKTNNHRHHEQ